MDNSAAGVCRNIVECSPGGFAKRTGERGRRDLAPDVTAFVILFHIAIWAVVTSVLDIVAAIRLRREITGEWLLIFGGIIPVSFGVLLMAQPIAGALALLWLIGAYDILFGIILVIPAFRARTFSQMHAEKRFVEWLGWQTGFECLFLQGARRSRAPVARWRCQGYCSGPG